MGSSRPFSVLMGLLVTGSLVLVITMPAHADLNMYDGNWHFTIAPYLWAPTVNGTLNFTAPSGASAGAPPASTTVGVTVGPNALFTHLNFGFLGYFEARKANWSIFADVLDLNLSNQASSVTTINFGSGPIHVDPSFNINTSSTLQTFLGSLAGSYTVWREDKSTLDVFGGAQYLDASSTVNWSLVGPLGLFPKSGSLSGSDHLVAGIIGVKGRINLGRSNWFVPYFLDGGAGGFTTWQGMVGIGYSFSWLDIVLTYRHLYIDTQGHVLQNTSLSGPMLGLAFNF